MPGPWLLLLACLGAPLACRGDDGPPDGPGQGPREGASPRGGEEAPTDTPVPGADGRLEWRGHRLLPSARWQVHQELLASRDAVYGAADGGGSARLVEGTDAVAGRPGRWVLEYRAGPLGIAPGGALYFQLSPFWEWSPPQTQSPQAPGYTRVVLEPPSDSATIEALPGQGLVLVSFPEQGLAAGSTVTFTYGEGPAGARADRWAEGQEWFYFWVDGDGDGTRRLLAEDVPVAVGPGPAADFVLHAPSAVRPGDSFRLSVAMLDARSNLATGFEGAIVLTPQEGLELPAEVVFAAEDRGARSVQGRALSGGVFRIEGRIEDQPRRSNPLLVAEGVVPVFWGDLHGHSTLSDGSATPEEYYRYARDAAGLDVAVLTDHDHFGMRKLDAEPALQAAIDAATAAFHEPGRFVTLHGYEWTSWLYGHRHVLYFDGPGPWFSSVDPATDTPSELWEALAARPDSMTIAHHTGGGPVAVDWSFPPPPEREPVVEIVSVHGTSESMEAPLRLPNPVAGTFANDALARGYQLGFVGSGDSHDGHPGMAHRNGLTGGVVALFAQELSSAGVRAALDRRACYATTGARIYLRFRLGGAPMGGRLSLPEGGALPGCFVYVLGTAPIRTVEVLVRGAPLRQVDVAGEWQAAFELADLEVAPGDWVYARVTQEDGACAWSSPIWIDAQGAPD